MIATPGSMRVLSNKPQRFPTRILPWWKIQFLRLVFWKYHLYTKTDDGCFLLRK